MQQYNKVYVHGQNGPENFDCAGLVWFVYNKLFDIDLYYEGIGLSTTTRIMTNSYGKIVLFEDGITNKDLSLVKQGDIVFFHRQSLSDTEPKKNNKYPGHCGIYLTDSNFIHCSRSKGKVIISNFNKNDYWKKVLVASKDIVSDAKILKKIYIKSDL